MLADGFRREIVAHRSLALTQLPQRFAVTLLAVQMLGQLLRLLPLPRADAPKPLPLEQREMRPHGLLAQNQVRNKHLSGHVHPSLKRGHFFLLPRFGFLLPSSLSGLLLPPLAVRLFVVVPLPIHHAGPEQRLLHRGCLGLIAAAQLARLHAGN
jgi:hypothetical protein